MKVAEGTGVSDGSGVIVAVAVGKGEGVRVGAEVTVQLGGNTDFPAIGLKGRALEVSGVVRCITDGTFTVMGPKNTGVRENVGRSAVLAELREDPLDDIGLLDARDGLEPAARAILKNHMVLYMA